jgi:hypothetical protein
MEPRAFSSAGSQSGHKRRCPLRRYFLRSRGLVVTTVHRLVAFYVDQHNRVLQHSAPDERYVGTGDTIPADLRARTTAARRARLEANRSAT